MVLWRTPRSTSAFLASPGDVAAERGLALSVLDRLPDDPLLRGRLSVEVTAWDKPGAGIPMLATMAPQAAVNRALRKPSECDIVVVIFWGRIGSPLPQDFKKPDGTSYLSGTEWEFEDALHAEARPEILVYRRMDTVPIEPDDPDIDYKTDQMRKVNDFFSKHFPALGGLARGGFNRYRKPEEFKEQFERHLKEIIKPLLDGQRDSEKPDHLEGKLGEQAKLHISAGDRLAKQKRFGQALQEYEKAAQIDTNRGSCCCGASLRPDGINCC